MYLKLGQVRATCLTSASGIQFEVFNTSDWCGQNLPHGFRDP